MGVLSERDKDPSISDYRRWRIPMWEWLVPSINVYGRHVSCGFMNSGHECGMRFIVIWVACGLHVGAAMAESFPDEGLLPKSETGVLQPK